MSLLMNLQQTWLRLFVTSLPFAMKKVEATTEFKNIFSNFQAFLFEKRLKWNKICFIGKAKICGKDLFKLVNALCVFEIYIRPWRVLNKLTSMAQNVNTFSFLDLTVGQRGVSVCSHFDNIQIIGFVKERKSLSETNIYAMAVIWMFL